MGSEWVKPFTLINQDQERIRGSPFCNYRLIRASKWIIANFEL